MVDNPNSKDKALEALDFIINILKKHEESLDKSIDALATITEQIGNPDSINPKVENIEKEINGLQKEVANLISNLSSVQKETQSVAVKEQVTSSAHPESSTGPSVILGCKQWEDFQTLALHAQTVSFSYKEDQKVFQVNALKGNQIITYNGGLPNLSIILREWLSAALGVCEQSIMEGFLERSCTLI